MGPGEPSMADHAPRWNSRRDASARKPLRILRVSWHLMHACMVCVGHLDPLRLSVVRTRARQHSRSTELALETRAAQSHHATWLTHGRVPTGVAAPPLAWLRLHWRGCASIGVAAPPLAWLRLPWRCASPGVAPLLALRLFLAGACAAGSHIVGDGRRWSAMVGAPS